MLVLLNYELLSALRNILDVVGKKVIIVYSVYLHIIYIYPSVCLPPDKIPPVCACRPASMCQTLLDTGERGMCQGWLCLLTPAGRIVESGAEYWCWESWWQA